MQNLEIDISIEGVESLNFDTLSEQLQYIFKTEQDIVSFVNFLKNIKNFVNLSNDKRHMTLVELGHFKAQIQLLEKKIQSLIIKKKTENTKQAIRNAKGAGEKITENVITYYSEENQTLESLEWLHNLVSAWASYMQDLYFMCGQTNKNLGGFSN